MNIEFSTNQDFLLNQNNKSERLNTRIDTNSSNSKIQLLYTPQNIKQKNEVNLNEKSEKKSKKNVNMNVNINVNLIGDKGYITNEKFKIFWKIS